MKDRETKRVAFNIPTDTLERIDEYASKMTINRTSAVLVLVNMALDSQKAVNAMEELAKLVKSTETV